jgi:hypothetical protein
MEEEIIFYNIPEFKIHFLINLKFILNEFHLHIFYACKIYNFVKFSLVTVYRAIIIKSILSPFASSDLQQSSKFQKVLITARIW